MNYSDFLERPIAVLLFDKTIYLYSSILKRSNYLFHLDKTLPAVNNQKEQELLINWLYYCYNNTSKLSTISRDLKLLEYIEELLYQMKLKNLFDFDFEMNVNLRRHLLNNFEEYLGSKCMFLLEESQLFVDCRKLFNQYETRRGQQEDIILRILSRLDLRFYKMRTNGHGVHLNFKCDIHKAYRVLGFPSIRAMTLPKIIDTSRFSWEKEWIIDGDIAHKKYSKYNSDCSKEITLDLGPFLFRKWRASEDIN